MRTLSRFFLILIVARGATAQSLTQRILGSDGVVDVVYPSRPETCGDGRSYVRGVFGSRATTYEYDSRDARGLCVHGPAHAAVRVMNGEITRIRLFVGPRDSTLAARTIRATPSETAEWLEHIIESERSPLASQALLPLMVVDGVTPWQALLNVARSDQRPVDLRRNVLMWLSSAIDARLGLDGDDESDDAQVRAQAVYTISQRNRSESVPTLMELARSSPHSEVRKAAIYWLGQTGDPRAVGVYAELLGLR